MSKFVYSNTYKNMNSTKRNRTRRTKPIFDKLNTANSPEESPRISDTQRQSIKMDAIFHHHQQPSYADVLKTGFPTQQPKARVVSKNALTLQHNRTEPQSQKDPLFKNNELYKKTLSNVTVYPNSLKLKECLIVEEQRPHFNELKPDNECAHKVENGPLICQNQIMREDQNENKSDVDFIEKADSTDMDTSKNDTDINHNRISNDVTNERSLDLIEDITQKEMTESSSSNDVIEVTSTNLKKNTTPKEHQKRKKLSDLIGNMPVIKLNKSKVGGDQERSMPPATVPDNMSGSEIIIVKTPHLKEKKCSNEVADIIPLTEPKEMICHDFNTAQVVLPSNMKTRKKKRKKSNEPIHASPTSLSDSLNSEIQFSKRVKLSNDRESNVQNISIQNKEYVPILDMHSIAPSKLNYEIPNVKFATEQPIGEIDNLPSDIKNEIAPTTCYYDPVDSIQNADSDMPDGMALESDHLGLSKILEKEIKECGYEFTIPDEASTIVNDLSGDRDISFVCANTGIADTGTFPGNIYSIPEDTIGENNQEPMSKETVVGTQVEIPVSPPSNDASGLLPGFEINRNVREFNPVFQDDVDLPTDCSTGEHLYRPHGKKTIETPEVKYIIEEQAVNCGHPESVDNRYQKSKEPYQNRAKCENPRKENTFNQISRFNMPPDVHEQVPSYNEPVHLPTQHRNFDREIIRPPISNFQPTIYPCLPPDYLHTQLLFEDQKQIPNTNVQYIPYSFPPVNDSPPAPLYPGSDMIIPEDEYSHDFKRALSRCVDLSVVFSANGEYYFDLRDKGNLNKFYRMNKMREYEIFVFAHPYMNLRELPANMGVYRSNLNPLAAEFYPRYTYAAMYN